MVLNAVLKISEHKSKLSKITINMSFKAKISLHNTNVYL